MSQSIPTRYNHTWYTVTLLHLAAAEGKVRHVLFLMNHGANCNAREPQSGATPLHWSVMTSNDPAVVKELIIGGAIVDARNVVQTTPLHLAVAYNRNQIAQELIARGAFIEVITDRT